MIKQRWVMRAVNHKHRCCKYRWKDGAGQTTEKIILPSNMMANAATRRYERDVYVMKNTFEHW